jgi:hypothetical protein
MRLQAMFFGIAAFIGICLLVLTPSRPLDDTDNKITGDRSNLRIYVDHGTGCQYLQALGGGLSVRLDSQAKPICKGPTK